MTRYYVQVVLPNSSFDDAGEMTLAEAKDLLASMIADFPSYKSGAIFELIGDTYDHNGSPVYAVIP